MNPLIAIRFPALMLFLSLFMLRPGLAFADLDDALSSALEAALPYAKQGFDFKENFWSGQKTKQTVAFDLVNGVEYWFWLSADDRNAKVSVHIYDKEGKLAEDSAWQKTPSAAAHIAPLKTGPHHLVIEILLAREKPTWVMGFGSKPTVKK